MKFGLKIQLSEIYMDDNKEKIVDALNQVSERYLIPVEEIAEALKIVNNITKEFLDSGDYIPYMEVEYNE